MRKETKTYCLRIYVTEADVKIFKRALKKIKGKDEFEAKYLIQLIEKQIAMQTEVEK